MNSWKIFKEFCRGLKEEVIDSGAFLHFCIPFGLFLFLIGAVITMETGKEPIIMYVGMGIMILPMLILACAGIYVFFGWIIDNWKQAKLNIQNKNE